MKILADHALKEYNIESDGISLAVKILYKQGDFVRTYALGMPEFGQGTKALIENLKRMIILDPSIKAEKMLDPKAAEGLRVEFREKAKEILKRELPHLDEGTKGPLLMVLLADMLGIGKLDILLCDSDLEEIAVNDAKDPAWVYHKEFGWLKTNVFFDGEEQIQNYANIIARRGGKQITTLNPLLDTHLVSGDRANATLFPISGKGNTITIRRFRRDPWTVTDFINNKTATSEVMALVWLAMQYELNIILSGGTASGKTSFLNVCLPFIQPNHRIISIEDTRELILPDFLHWVPMTTREPNPEGKGGVCLYPGNWVVLGNGEIREISEYAEEKLTTGEKFKPESNLTCVLGEDSVLAGNPAKMEYGSEKIATVSKVTERKFICTVKCENGETTVLTENTRLPVVGEKGEVELLLPNEIKEGKYYLPVFTKISVDGALQEIDVIDLYSKGDYYTRDVFDELEKMIQEAIESGKTLKDIASKIGISRQALNWQIKNKLVKINLIKELLKKTGIATHAELNQKIIGIRPAPWSAKTATVPKVCGEEVAYLAGFLQAEKCVGKARLSVAQKEEIPFFEELVQKLFSIKASKGKTRNQYGEYNNYIILSKTVTRFFTELFGLKKSKECRVPAIIQRSPENIIAAYLSGYIDGDGSVGEKKISLAVGRKETAIEFKYLLHRLGINSRIAEEERVFVVNISAREDMKKAAQTMKFRVPGKKDRAEKILAKKYSHNTRRNIVPALLLRNFLKGFNLTTTEKKERFYHTKCNKNGMSKTYVKQLMESNRLTDEVAGKISFFLRDDIEFVKISGVEIIPNTSNIPTYDLTPEKSTYFVGGINNFTLIMDTMLDLLVNSLRQRPDRIIVGETRRRGEAEVMFEAMHTGHSVYTTFHANTADETIRRLINPPMDIPESQLEAVHMNVVMFRNRRLGVRRILELAEFVPEKRGSAESLKANTLYRWRQAEDKISKYSESIRLMDEFALHTGLTYDEINRDLAEKRGVLDWLVKNNVHSIDEVGRVMAKYYLDRNAVVAAVQKNKKAIGI